MIMMIMWTYRRLFLNGSRRLTIFNIYTYTKEGKQIKIQETTQVKHGQKHIHRQAHMQTHVHAHTLPHTQTPPKTILVGIEEEEKDKPSHSKF